MPASSPLRSLPPDLLNELYRRLRAAGFQNHKALLEWLNGEIGRRGMAVTISLAALSRWCKEKKDLLDREMGRVAFVSGMSAVAPEVIPDIQAARRVEIELGLYECTMGMNRMQISQADPDELLEKIKGYTNLSLAEQRMMRTALIKLQHDIATVSKAAPARPDAGRKADGGEKAERDNEPGLPDEVMDRVDAALMPDGEED